jgi:hypothetical protein
MKRLLVVLSLTVVALSLSPVALAQDDSFVCNALLRHGVYDKYREIRSSASASQLQTHICEAYTKLQQDKTAGHVEANYFLVGGEGSYSREQLESIGQFMCADTFNASSASSALTLIQDKISPAAMDAYRECIAQNSSGLKTKTVFREEDQGQVTIEVRYVAPVGAAPQTTINKIVLTPLDAFKCQGPLWDLQGKANGVGTNAVAMSCERKIATTPFSSGGQSILAGPNTIAVLTTSGTLTRSLTTILAAPPPTPLNIPIGTIIAFSGTMAEAETQKQFGWWVCNGQTVNDPLATSYNGKAVPNLLDKFLEGSTQSGGAGGASKFTVDLKDPIESRSYGFNGPTINMDPRVVVSSSLSWVNGTPIASRGNLPKFDVPTVPPFYSVIYLVKVR